MAFLMSGFLTLVNTGYDEAFVNRWSKAFTLASVMAMPLAVIVGPFAHKLATRLVKKIISLEVQ